MTTDHHSPLPRAVAAAGAGVLRKTIDTLESCTHHDEKAIRNGVKQIMTRDIMGMLGAISTALHTPGWGARLCAVKLAAMRLASGLVMQFPVKVKEVFPAMAGAVASFAQEAFSVFCKRCVVPSGASSNDCVCCTLQPGFWCRRLRAPPAHRDAAGAAGRWTPQSTIMMPRRRTRSTA